MIDKTTDLEEAVALIPEGATVMVGGFGVPGTPFNLLAELARQGQRGLTLIKNDANETGMGIDHLLKNGQVDRLITTHIGLNSRAISLMNEGRLAVEFCAQGILAERIRAAGAGLLGIATDVGLDTSLAEGKARIRTGEREVLLETALTADVALVHARRADTCGNLAYVATARNFNPLMAMAANLVLAEAEEVVAPGGLGPDEIHTPSPFVDAVAPIPQLHEEYTVVRR